MSRGSIERGRYRERVAQITPMMSWMPQPAHADSSTLVHKATVLQSEADSGGARHAHVVRTWELCEKQCTLRVFVIEVG